MARRARAKSQNTEASEASAKAKADTGTKPDQAGAVKAPAAQKAAAAKSDAAATDPAGKPSGEIVVVGPKQGRRRAGRRFTPEPTVIPLSELSEAQIAALEADPLLVVASS